MYPLPYHSQLPNLIVQYSFIWPLWGVKPQSWPILIYCQFGTALRTWSKILFCFDKMHLNVPYRKPHFFFQAPTCSNIGTFLSSKEMLQNLVPPIQSHSYKPTHVGVPLLDAFLVPCIMQILIATIVVQCGRSSCTHLTLCHSCDITLISWHHKSPAMQPFFNSFINKKTNIKPPHRWSVKSDIRRRPVDCPCIKGQ